MFGNFSLFTPSFSHTALLTAPFPMARPAPTPPHPILVPWQIAHGSVKKMPTLAFCCICSSGRDAFDFLVGLPPSLPTLASSFSMLEETDQRAQGTLAEVWLSGLSLGLRSRVSPSWCHKSWCVRCWIRTEPSESMR